MDNEHDEVADGDGNPEFDEFWDPENPTFFQVGLTPEGQKGGFHVSRYNEGLVRTAVPTFDSGSKKGTPVAVSSAAKLIVHGTLDEIEDEEATLLVYDFELLAKSSARITSATIKLVFDSPSGARDGPLVQRVAPWGSHTMTPPSREASAARSMGDNSSGGGGGGGGDGGGGSKVLGTKPANAWGDSMTAEWEITEKTPSGGDLRGGVPWHFRAAVLVKRPSDKPFSLKPSIHVQPAGERVLSSAAVEKPIVFDPIYEPFDNDKRKGTFKVDRWNLASLDLSEFWGWEYK